MSIIEQKMEQVPDEPNHEQTGNGNGHSPDAVIVRDARICGGEPVIKGTRVLVRTLLSSLAAGSSESEILREFPTVTASQLRAVIAFAAAAALDDIPIPGAVFHAN